MSDTDARSCAHVDGHRAGVAGRPAVAPPHLSEALQRVWLAGHAIGSKRYVREVA